MPVEAQPCIEAESVSFHYNGNEVLYNLSFTIAAGDYVGILGPNGSGKTTLLKLILGLLAPTAGSIRIFGEEARDFRYRSFLGYVPQRASQTTWAFPATVLEIVRNGRTAAIGIGKRFRAEDETIVHQAMKTTEVFSLQHRLIASLSGGERQRVFIAQALATEPKILILDEPTVGVDIAAQETFYRFIKQLNEQQQMTILFVSHDIDVATAEAKTILCLNRELVCHVSSADFITKDHLEKLYGKRGKYILHGH